MAEKYEFVCTTCHKEFKRQENLNRHLLTHTNEKTLKCNETGKHVIIMTTQIISYINYILFMYRL